MTSFEKESLCDLFSKICYSPNYEQTMNNVGKLYEVKGLQSYLEKEIVPFLHMFARSCIGNVHCCGYNVTSPAESMNNLLKRGLPDHYMTLVESRIEFDSSLKNHDQILYETHFNKRIPVNDKLFKYFTQKSQQKFQFKLKNHIK